MRDADAHLNARCGKIFVGRSDQTYCSDAESYFVPAIYCPDERTALFAWALFAIGS